MKIDWPKDNKNYIEKRSIYFYRENKLDDMYRAATQI